MTVILSLLSLLKCLVIPNQAPPDKAPAAIIQPTGVDAKPSAAKTALWAKKVVAMVDEPAIVAPADAAPNVSQIKL
jgi:hypothetical protein